MSEVGGPINQGLPHVNAEAPNKYKPPTRKMRKTQIQIQMQTSTSPPPPQQQQESSPSPPTNSVVHQDPNPNQGSHDSSGSGGPMCGRRAKRVRRNHHKRMSRSQFHIRRVIQPAPNNNNEFLMQEHDDMYHFESQQPHFRLVSTEDDEEMRMGRGGSDPFGSQSSSLDDEEEFLNRDFSNAYDVIHAERLNSMTKIELIQEYQLLEERVETLERKIRTRHSLQPIQTGGSGSPYHTTGSPYHTTGSPFHPASKGSYGGSDIPIKLLEEEVRDLREENRKLRLENKMLAARRQLPSEMASEENEIDQ